MVENHQWMRLPGNCVPTRQAGTWPPGLRCSGPWKGAMHPAPTGPTPLPTSMEQMPEPGPVCAILSSDPVHLRHWNERRALFWKQRQQEQGAVVFLGDSITALWNDLPGRFPGIAIANRGIGSDATAGARFRLQEDVLDLAPRGVVLLLGTNDLAMNASAAATASGLEAILDRLVLRGKPIPTIIGTILPRSDVLIAKQTQELNLAVRAIAARRGLALADLHPALCDQQGGMLQSCFLDGAHPNASGYDRMHAVLAPLVGRQWGMVVQHQHG